MSLRNKKPLERQFLRECTFIYIHASIPDSPSPDSFISGPFLDNFILQAVEDIT